MIFLILMDMRFEWVGVFGVVFLMRDIFEFVLFVVKRRLLFE